MKTLSHKDRVIVVETNNICINAPGTVERVRRDGGAWVALDKRSTQGRVHPFSETDNRATHVLAYPEDCKPCRKNHKERRAAKKHDRVSAQPEVTFEMFGRDHWSTFAYIETRVVDHDGRAEREKMRCDVSRHPHLIGPHYGDVGKKYPTRLAGDVLLEDHDDWDCADDLVCVGLLENLGTSTNPIFRLTDEGWSIAKQFRMHRAEGGSTATFRPTREAQEKRA
jgi:hypothetical protein